MEIFRWLLGKFVFKNFEMSTELVRGGVVVVVLAVKEKLLFLERKDEIEA